MGPTCPVNVSEITMSPHTGSHTDAPLHYDPCGASLADVPLGTYLGPCRVIHAIGCGPLVQWSHLAHALQDLPPRVLVRCYERAPQDRFDPALPAYAPDTVERLAALGVRLIGIDSASIDPADSKPLPSHQVIRRLGLRGITDRLDEVPHSVMALPVPGPLGDREHRDNLPSGERLDPEGNPLPPPPGYYT